MKDILTVDKKGGGHIWNIVKSTHDTRIYYMRMEKRERKDGGKDNIRARTGGK